MSILKNKNLTPIRTIDFFLPRAIRENSSLSLVDLIRARILACSLASAVVIIWSLLVSVCLLHYIFNKELSLAMIVVPIVTALSSIQYLFFFTAGKLKPSASLFALSFFVAISTCVFFSGGHYSPFIPILVCSPVIAFLINGKREGYYYAGLTLIFGFMLVGFDIIDLNPRQILKEENHFVASALSWFITLSLLVTSLTVFDFLLDKKKNYNDAF